MTRLIQTSRMVTINELAGIVEISRSSVAKNHIDGPQGVRGRKSGQHEAERGFELGTRD